MRLEKEVENRAAAPFAPSARRQEGARFRLRRHAESNVQTGHRHRGADQQCSLGCYGEGRTKK